MTRLATGTQYNRPLHLRGSIVSELDIPKETNRRINDVYAIENSVAALHDMGLCHFVPGIGRCYSSSSNILTFVDITDLREYFKAGDILYVIVEEASDGTWRGIGKSNEVLDGPYQVAVVAETRIQFTSNLSPEVLTYDSSLTAKKFRVFRTPATIIPQKKNVFTSNVKKANSDEEVWIDGAKNLTNVGSSAWDSVGDPQVFAGDFVTLTAGGFTQMNEVDSITSDTVLVMVDDWSANLQDALLYDSDAVSTFTIYRPLSVYVDIAHDETAKTIKAVEATAKFDTAGSFKIESGDEVFIEVMDLTNPENVVTHWLRGTVDSVTDDQTFVLTYAISNDADVLALFDTAGEAVSTFGISRTPFVYLTDAATTAKTIDNGLGAFAGWNTYGENQILAGDKVSLTVTDVNGVNWTLTGFVASITDDNTIVLATKLNQDSDLTDLLDGSSNNTIHYQVERFDSLVGLNLTAGKLLVWTGTSWKQI